jgi:tetratricopeptide (TPR) repeat protein
MKKLIIIIFLIGTLGLTAQTVDENTKYEYDFTIDTSKFNYNRGRIKDLSFFIKMSPNNYEYYLERGYLFLQLKDYKNAKVDLNKAFKLNKSNNDIKHLKDMITAIFNVQSWMNSKFDNYKSLQFDEFFIQNYSNEIQNKLNTNESIKFSIVHNYLIGDSLIKGTYFHLDSTLNIIDKMSFSEMVDLTMSILPLEDSFSETVEERLKRATNDIKANPDKWNNYVIKAGAEEELGNIQKALYDYEKALELIPKEEEFFYMDLPLIHTNIGDLKYQLGDVESAFSNFEKAIEYNPEYEYAYLIRGKKNCETGNKTLGCKDFKKVLELNPYAIEDGMLSKENLENCCK